LFETFASIAGLIPFFPLAAFAIIVLFTNPNKRLSSNIAIGAMAISALLAVLVFLGAWGVGGRLAEEPYWSVTIPWAPIGDTVLEIGWVIDPLSATTLAMVGIVCLMIFIYSQGYMAGDPLYSRFFAYISLFACGMLGFVLSDNLLTAVIFWEIMGLCSYLLIGFWFDRPKRGVRKLGGVYDEFGKLSPSDSGKKAFLTTRVGDVMFLLGIWAIYARTGSLSLRHVLSEETLAELAHSVVTLIPSVITLGGLSIPLPFALGVPAATIIAILLFGGAVGKSAQFPLHVWLPDAMAGPTPVSALIHAATMVAAGVYLVARTFPIFAVVEHGHGPALQLVAFIGAFTALFAATMGLAQDDIKRVLAYSTISQLGYMIMALGIGAFVAAVFHLITHAFFKALLFLGSGSVIHGVEHGYHETHVEGQHEPFDPNDMLNMGGLREKMPITFWTFLIGALALTGIFPFAGFWSKDEILADAFNHGHMAIWAVGTVAAFLTALYMARQTFLVFFGRPRTGAAGHAVESVPSMTVPLIVLAFFATVLGFAGPTGLFHSFVGELFEPTRFNPAVAGISLLIAATGWAVGAWLYWRRPLVAGQPDPMKALGPIYTLLNRKYFVDEFYLLTFVKATELFSRLNGVIDLRVVDGLVNLAGIVTAAFSRLSGWIDLYIVDGVVNLVGYVTSEVSAGLRLIQTGRVQNYLLIAFFSLLVLVGLMGFAR